MKMKEKKTEEVVEEVVDTPKISDELKEYLEFARFCVYQQSQFSYRPHQDKRLLENLDELLEMFGIEITKPISIITGFTNDNIEDYFNDFYQNWIDKYNALDLSKLSNYHRDCIFAHFSPAMDSFVFYKDQIKVKLKHTKCVQHTTEE
jgi:hypothetical protein